MKNYILFLPTYCRLPNKHSICAPSLDAARRVHWSAEVLAMSITAESARSPSTAQPAPWITEDWLSLWIGFGIFVLALGGLVGIDLLGWVVSTSVWTDPSQALGTVSKAYASLGGTGALLVTYLALLVVLTAGAAALNLDVKRFAITFSPSPLPPSSRWPMRVGSLAATPMSPQLPRPICKSSTSAGL
jgi:hypothetical protein